MTTTLTQTPLHAWHASHGGRMVDFAGWSMSVQYTSIVAEHSATRNAVGLFDVSHMGRFRVVGPGAEALFERVVTRKIAGMRSGHIRYALITNDNGGIRDDVLVYRLDRRDEAGWLMVVNAGNRQKIWECLADARPTDGVELADITHETAMIAVQGPRALEIVRPLCEIDPATLRYYTAREVEMMSATAIMSRTGYTGEDGLELIVPADSALELWETLFVAARRVGGTAAGLGCRDTLRLEAGMPLYGHELDETINPFQARLSYAVQLDNRSFPGSRALATLRHDVTLPARVGLRVEGKRVPREGHAVLSEGRPVGQITSGTFSPTLNVPIAMGYVRPDLTTPGTLLAIDIRGHHEGARVVPLPFYRRTA